MRKRRLSTWVSAIAMAWAGTGAPFANAAPVSTPHVQVDLLSEHKTIQPGRDFSVGVHFQLEDGWHIYWINAGDSGQGPSVQWKLPPGFTAGAFAWPAPERLPAAPLMNYGYENHVLLTVPLHAPDDVAHGKSVTLGADLRWLVCREVCIPGKAQVTRSLSVSAAAPSLDAETEPFFEEARSRLPKPFPPAWRTEVAQSADGVFTLRVSGSALLREAAKTAVFFPLDPDRVENAVPQLPHPIADGLELTLKRSEQLEGHLEKLRGVLALRAGAYFFEAPVMGEGGASPKSAPTAPAPSLLSMLFFAFVGGLILNLMPCVFPVLSIKVLSFVKTSSEGRARLRWHGLAYTAGILISFWVLVGTLIALRSGGQQLGWGFQLQSPLFVAFLAVFMFLFGLNLAGVFEIGSGLMDTGSSLANQEGLRGSFFTGVLATVVATPCSAPFMGSAVGFALAQSAAIAFLVFTFLAFGLALPYLLLSVEPSLGRLLPRPGRWMETLKQAMAFPIFATVLWLAWVFGVQAGMESLFRLLGSLLLVGLVAWMLGRWPARKAAWVAALAILAMALALGFSGAHETAAETVTAVGAAPAAAPESLEWEKFAPEKIDAYRGQGRAVFLDFTAAWCVSCKVNELLVFRSEDVKRELKRLGIVLMKADWTTYDPVITRTLAQFGRSGVPLYVIYPADPAREPLVLPEIINSGIVLRSLSSLTNPN